MYIAKYKEKATGKVYEVQTGDYNEYDSAETELIDVKPCITEHLTAVDLWELFNEL